MERIRPRAADLNEVDDDDLIDWPPAACVVRGKAPAVSSASTATPDPLPPRPRPLLGSIRERDTPPENADAARPGGGKPLSAFRRARMQRSDPPKPPAPAPDAPLPLQDPTRDPGGGAGPEAVSTLLADIAQDNERKIAHMSYADREEELRDAEAFFGKDLLAKLAQRRAQPQAARGWPELERLSIDDAPIPSAATPPPAPTNDTGDELERLRATYFPDEPPTVPAPLAWTVEAPTVPDSEAQPRFDFHGRVISRPNDVYTEAPDATYLAGLHHHGQNPTAPGYTLEELWHWSRSHVASQRCMALAVLQRIATTYPLDRAADSDVHRMLNADACAVRARLLFTARYLLDDRHRSVARAAAECLAAACQSVSSVGTQVLLASEAPVAADPTLDWHAPHLDATDVHARPPSFHAPDASHLELLQHDWVDGLRTTHLFDALERHLADPDAPTAPVCEILCAMALHTSAAAQDLCARPTLVPVLVAHGATRSTWPLAKTPWPQSDALLALLRMVQVSKTCAAALVVQGALDPVLRYIILPPQDLLAPQAASYAHHEHVLATIALRIYAALGRYGLNSTSVREFQSSLPTWGAWAARIWPQLGDDDVRWYTMHALFDLLHVWTCAAIQGPAHGDLGANWPAVQGWHTYSLAVLSQRGSSSSLALVTQGCAAAHLATWYEAAQRFSLPADTAAMQQIAQALHTKWASMASMDMTAYAPRMAAQTDAATVQTATINLSRMARAWRAFLALAHATASTELATLAHAQLLAILRLPLRELCSAARAADSLVTAHRTCIVASCWGIHGTEALLRQLLALGPEEPTLAAQALPNMVAPAGPTVWAILAPFFLDNVRAPKGRASLVAALQNKAPLDTLQVQRPEPLAVDTDPRTGEELWQSRAAGLPLRIDWPLLAIDDLLHSGEAHVFNVRDGLPADWDWSEADVVQATLDVGLYVAEQHVIPSAYLWLAMIKIFLLELAPPAHPAATGAATGRDLYAWPPVATRLERLMAVADAPSQDHTLLLDEAAAHVLSPNMPLYQLYTDVLGLYESISMHHPLFARVLLPPLAMAYEADYRRLFWREYAMLLPGIRVGVDEAPCVRGARLDAYLWPCESDKDVLLAYAHALAQGRVSPAQPLLYAIAVHHTSAALWHDEGDWGIAPLPGVQALLARTVLTAPPFGLCAPPRG
ncbi:hypothetical protein MNAN1_000174 [Malassezia nana]|uniref:RNA polymerase II-associated protein 1 n=1 Tax=Malassezia nana TaxID=180528 RepID=A0AAF0J248_9BASI|nr:hypothetical protein MNAN1_000174 [Malassezia nana]